MGFDSPDKVDITFRTFIDVDTLSYTLKSLNSELILQMAGVDQTRSAILDNQPHRTEIEKVDSDIQTERTDQETSIMSVLNRDCLWAILEHLDSVDLCEVAATCKQLNSLVFRIFRKRDFDYKQFENKPLQRVETYFRFFGRYLLSVDANKFRSQQVVLGMISKYCKNIVAMSCTVCCQKTLAELQPILWKLKSLDILCGSDVAFQFGKIFDKKSPIEQLKLDHSGSIVLPQIKLKNLVDLKLCSTYFPDEKVVSNFFQLNKQLKKLHLERVLTLSGCNYILKGLNNLEELVLFDYASNYFAPHLACFAELTKLRKLRVWAHIADFGDSFKALKYSEIQLDYKQVDRDATGTPIVEYDQKRRITSLKLYKPFTTFNKRRSNWVTDEMLQAAASLFPNVKEILIESWKLSLNGIFTALNAGTQLQIASFVIRSRMVERSTSTEVQNVLHNILRLVTSRQIKTSIEIVKSDEYVSYPARICGNCHIEFK